MQYKLMKKTSNNKIIPTFVDSRLQAFNNFNTFKAKVLFNSS